MDQAMFAMATNPPSERSTAQAILAGLLASATTTVL
jgi:hypothetical protein